MPRATRHPEALGYAALALATGTAFAICLGHRFLNWDDPFLLEANAPLRRFELGPLLRQVSIGIWHPVTLLVLALEHRAFGLDPFAFHLTSLLLHAANALLAVCLARRALGLEAPVAFLAGALFALHPLHVEAVAWVAERKELLSSGFGLLALLAWARFAEGRRPVWYAACALALTLALLSKPMAVTLPLAMLLLDHHRGRALRGRALLEKLPFFALALAAGLGSLATQAPHPGERIAIFSLSPLERLGLPWKSLAFYTSKLLFPPPQSAYYDIDLVRVEPFRWALAAAALAGLSAAALRGPGAGNGARFGLLFYLLTLAPVAKLVPFGGNSLFNDRYAYLPSLGLLLGLALPFGPLLRQAAPWRAAALVGAGLLLGLLGWQTREYARVWRDSETLWSHVLTRYPGTSLALNHLGRHYLEAQGDLDRSLALFEAALRARPDSPAALANLAEVRARRGELAAAEQALRGALALAPDDVDLRRRAGRFLLDAGRAAEAAEQLEVALARWPEQPRLHQELGHAYRELGQLGRARAAYERALALDPGEGEVWAALGDLYLGQQQLREALHHYELAARLGVAVDAEQVAELRRRLGR
jgi:Tfp pilus assembly protein PilF